MKKTLLKGALLSIVILGVSYSLYQKEESQKEIVNRSVEKTISNKSENKSTLVVNGDGLNEIGLQKKPKVTLVEVVDEKITTESKYSATEDSISNLKMKYASYLKNHPFAKTKSLPKSERKAMGIPPNAYFEQEWLYSSNPNLNRPEPEVLFQLQAQLDAEEALDRIPGDGLDNQWVERGPNNVGGRTRAIIFAPGSTTKVFAGSVSGGLWVNNDITSSASSWLQVNGVPGNLAVSSITVDPNNPNIMYIGTGEIYTGGDVNGNGVYKSIDGGNNWTNIYGAATNANIRDNIAYIQDIIAWNNPTTNLTEVYFGVDAYVYGQQVIAGANGWAWLGLNRIGLYKSTDGENFNRIEDAVLKNASNRHYAPNTFDVGADGKLWMGTKYCAPYGVAGGMIFSTSNGTTWNNVRDFGTNGRVEVVASKQNAGRLYVLLENRTGGGLPTIRRTTDGFASNNVTVALPVSTGNQPPAANDFCRGQAFYDLMIGLNPSNDNEVYVGGIEIFKTTTAFTANAAGMWTQYTDWTLTPTANGSTSTLRDGVHSDHHCMAFAPGLSSRVVFGCDGGIYYSNNGGNSIGVRNKDFITTQFVKAGINQTGANQKLVAGAQDNGTQFINNAPIGAGASSTIAGGDGFYCFVDKQDEYIISSYVYNVYKMHDINGNQIGAGIYNSQTDGDFVNQCGLDSTNDILYTNGSNTTDGFRIIRFILDKATGGFSAGSAFLTNALLDETPTAFVSSNFTNNRLNVGLANGKLLRLNNANGAATWSSIGDASWVGAVSDIRYGATEDDIFVTFHNYGVPSVWYTANGSAASPTWQNKEGDLPNIPVKCILQNPFATNEVVIGTELGVWYTDNFSAASPNWKRANNGMKDVKVTAFDYRAVDNTILASTYGRGMFTGEFWSCGSITTSWNGSSWNNGAPNKRVAAIFNGNYNSVGDIEACSVTVNGTAQVTINSGHTLKVGEDVSVASGALLSIENNAALVQYSSSAVNTGNVLVKRNSEAMLRQAYTAWSSPVSGQKLKAFSPNTLDTRFYTYNVVNSGTPTTAYTAVPNPATTNFTVGKGYMIRSADNSSSTIPAVHNGQFVGVPNTGKITSSVGVGYNLLGNPYPSPIDANRVLITNPGLNTLYFWTHRVAAVGNAYPVNNFASYTILGGAASQGGSIIPNGTIQTGQGFYVDAKTANSIVFENELRRDASTSTQFFRNASISNEENVEKHRIWLNLKSTDIDYNQILVGYMNGATSGIDQMIDGEVLDKSKTMLYNLVSGIEYVIQGRGLPFTDADIVPLGLKVIDAGNFEITLENLDGLFVSQEVFIKDNETGVLHNIKQGGYSFTSQAGTFNNRFEIVYKNAVLPIENFVNGDDVNIYVSNGILNVVSSKSNITSVEVYTILGKVIYTNKNINALEFEVSSLTASNQTLIVKITLGNGQKMEKKIIL